MYAFNDSSNKMLIHENMLVYFEVLHCMATVVVWTCATVTVTVCTALSLTVTSHCKCNPLGTCFRGEFQVNENIVTKIGELLLWA